MKRIVLFIGICLYLSHTAYATTFYVSVTSGSNSNSCSAAQNQATPKQSMGNLNGNGAISCMQPGDTMVLRAGTYPEALYLGIDPFSGLVGTEPAVPNGIDDAHRSVVMAFPGEHPVITNLGNPADGNSGVNPINGRFITYDGIDIDGIDMQTTAINGNSNSNMTFQNFEMKNLPYSAIQMGDGNGLGFHDVLYKNLKIHDGPRLCTGAPTSHAFYLNSSGNDNSQHVVIDGLELYNWNVPAAGPGCNNGFGIQIYESGAGMNIHMVDFEVINSYIHDNTQDAAAIGTGTNFLIANNVWARNGCSGVDVVGGLDIGFNLTVNPLIANNTFVGNCGYATGNGGFGDINGARFSNNIFWQNGNNDQISPDFNGTFHHTDDHNLQAVNPQFVNQSANDFHITAASPAAGAGADLSSFFTTDKDGLLRVAPWSIGAFVVGGGGPTPPTITTVSLPNGVVGTAYTATVTATGGTPPYTWSATGLPAGLNISSGGVITGTPTAAGTSQVNVTVTDSMAATATKQLSLMVSTTATTLTMSVASGPCTLGGTLTINPVGTNWSFPGVTVSTTSAPATCTVRIHDNSPTNPAPDVISAPFTVSADGGIIPTLQFTQQPTNTISGHAFTPPVAGTRQ